VPTVAFTSCKAILLHREKSFLTSAETFPLPGYIRQRLPVVEENATNDRQRHDEVCLVMEAGGAAIGIVCKAPQPGRSKTRLAHAIGAAAACELSACFLRDVAAAIEAVPERLGRRGYVVYAPAGTEDIMRQLLPPGFGLLLQAGDDLGHVLSGATRAFLSAGHDCMLLVNGDSPTLPPRLLTQAIEILRQPGDHMVLGPASDGGYYLIGLKHPHPKLFERIAWGTDSVARATCERAAEIGLATTLLAEWYDVDDVQTLRWLQEELFGHSTRFRGGGFAAASRAFLKAAPPISP
jgi:rSAM/selenodomain-associated transferase 1